MSDYPDQPMCPNCVTPWKCNGPHITEGANMTAPSETPQVNDKSFTVEMGSAGFVQVVGADLASSLETALTESRKENEHIRKVLKVAENDYQCSLSRLQRTEAECERLRQQCEAEIALRHDAAARTILAETREREAMQYASTLATSLWKSHYKADSPHWALCGSLSGVLTQIDNMASGLIKEREAYERAAKVCDAMNTKGFPGNLMVLQRDCARRLALAIRALADERRNET